MEEHSSLFGLRVKVHRTDEFPCGKQYHRHTDYMKALIRKDLEISPYLFHMSWTENKDDKLLFFKQMGWWYVSSECEGSGAIHAKAGSNACCSAEPLVSCHYSDKPAIIDCHDSPKLDARGKLFWPL